MAQEEQRSTESGIPIEPIYRAADLEGFDSFVHEVASLLAFKELPVPGGANFELVASQPGQCSIGWNAGGARPEGLAFDRERRI